MARGGWGLRSVDDGKRSGVYGTERTVSSSERSSSGRGVWGEGSVRNFRVIRPPADLCDFVRMSRVKRSF